jgi:hypothetical protein
MFAETVMRRVAAGRPVAIRWGYEQIVISVFEHYKSAAFT